MKMSVTDIAQSLDYEDEDIDVDEAAMEPGYINNPIYNKIYEMTERFSGTYVGQYVTEKMDNLLKLIEDTAKWSLPPKNTSETITPLKRPLPWIPFLGLILILRLVRIGISVAGLLIGNSPLVPSDVVYFIQTRRRKLRAIRISGKKQIGKKEQLLAHKQKSGLLSSVTSILSMAICRPKLNEDSQNIFVNENCFEVDESFHVRKTQQNHNSSKHLTLEDEITSDHELTLHQILEKYGASSNEEDDSDFVPPSDALNDADTSLTSTSSSSSSDEDKNNGGLSKSTKNVLLPSICNSNPETNEHTFNGNISVECQELSLESKENEEHINKKLKKPKTMPKPIKEEHLPLPMHEIKQEPADSDQEINKNSEDVLLSNDYDKHPNKSTDELAKDNEERNDITSENGKHNQIVTFNGNPILFQSGSPDLCGSYGFQPTSIVKNCEAVALEKGRSTDTIEENENFIKGERRNELASKSNPTKSTNYSGKGIKNKFRGKRR